MAFDSSGKDRTLAGQQTEFQCAHVPVIHPLHFLSVSTG